MATSKSIYPRLGDLLVARGLISEEQLAQALREQKDSNKRLGDILTEQGLISPNDLVDVLSERLGIPKISIAGITADPEVVHTIPLRIAKKHLAVALFKINDMLTVAMADPLDMVAIDEIRFQTGLKVNRVISTPSDIEAAIAHFYSVAENVERVISDAGARSQGRETGESDAPIIQLVDVLLSEAVKQQASDMHIEPLEDSLRVRFRVDGILREEAHPPVRLHPAIVSRIKVMAGMDVSEKRIPQDGRFGVGSGRDTVDMRVSTIPTIYGEKVVVRLLGRHGLDLRLAAIGLSKDQQRRLAEEFAATEGMILICGPTSSGKTTTLYAALAEITTPEKNIVTVEDPVEYALPHVNQVQVNERAGLSFATALRAFMRQNPDVIMVGEVRDTPTAQIATRAAMTGHLVLSTIHTIDAAAVPHRLIDMGVEPFLVATALRAAIAQRLVRRLCPDCSVPMEPTELMKEQLGFDMLGEVGSWRRAVGCRQCRGTGYRGRIGIFEVLNIDDEIRRMISENCSTGALREYVSHRGLHDLRHQARELISQGRTTPEEALRVIPRRAELLEVIV
ncbi:MAG TPA: GspE/PulE family protein [candidate division Zixibacteria bacterium]|jgi:type IV pilus assembly protein PilB